VLDVKNLNRWQANSGKGRQATADEVLIIEPLISANSVNWRLPPSKSHLIRLAIIAAQTEASVRLTGTKGAGEDARSMARCLGQLGVDISFDDDSWVIQGVGKNGFIRPTTILNCGNSGTTFRLLTALCARLPFTVMLDGDRSLRRRGGDALWLALERCEVELSHGKGGETLPLMIRGPWNPKHIDLDVSNSSQPLSALRLAAIAAPQEFTLRLSGAAVSRRHFELSDALARMSGSPDMVSANGDEVVIHPWNPTLPENVVIPGDASHAVFALLFCQTHRSAVNIPNWPGHDDALGHEILDEIAPKLGLRWDCVAEMDEEGEVVISSSPQTSEHTDIDLRDANDLITPLAAILALGGGGRIHSAGHAVHKESNRIEKTVELLAQFAILARPSDDGLEITGGQSPQRPDKVVLTYGDHRLQMSAVILASKCGGAVQGPRLHQVSFPEFLSTLEESGVVLSSSVRQLCWTLD
jgi:3-phosphoshikimate 1-carboxyvinyltransferase